MKHLLVSLVLLTCPASSLPVAVEQAAAAGVSQTPLIGRVGQIVIVDPGFTGEVAFIIPSAIDNDAYRYHDRAAKKLIVVPPAGGVYEIHAITAKDSQPQYTSFRLVVEGGPPRPDDPLPDPISPLQAKLKAAYEADVAAGEGTPAMKDKTATAIRGLPALLDKIKTSSQVKLVIDTFLTMTGSRNMPRTIAVIAEHIRAALPAGDVPLTDAHKAVLTKACLDIASAIDKIGAAPGPAPFEAEVERLTRTVLAAGGSKSTAAALAGVYASVADDLTAGRVAAANALTTIRTKTDATLMAQSDRAAWTVWRTSIGDALTILQQQGALTTADQYAAVLRQIANGLKRVQ